MNKLLSIFKTASIIYRESKIRLIVSVILLLMISLLPLLQLHATNLLVKEISGTNIQFVEATKSIIIYGLVILLCNSKTLVNILGSYLWITAEISLQKSIIDKASQKNMLFYDTPMSFRKLGKANEGYGYAVGNTMMFISTIFITVISFLSVTAYLVKMNGFVVLFLLFIIPIKIIATNKIIYNLQLLRDAQAEDKIRVQKFSTYISSKDSRVYGTQKFFFDKWYSLFSELLNQDADVSQKNLIIELCSDLLCFLIYGFVLVVSIINSTSTVEIIGDAVVLFIAMETIFNSINSIITQLSDIMRNTSLSTDLFDFLNDDDNEQAMKDICNGHFLELKNTYFSYPNCKEPTLKNISLKIKLGENIAIVGNNGAGKTTLVKILAGLYKPSKGNVFYGDEFNLSNQKYDNISIVPQEAMIYNLSLKDNIKISNIYSDNDIDAKKILLNVLGEEKVNAFDDGSETFVGKEFGGIDLSGGEKQRISYGRAIYRNNTLLFLDEPTSAIDPLTEKKIYKEFLELSKETTTIFVTHRLASVKFADRIIVIDGGEIVESGTHAELLSLDGVYAQMYSLQKNNF